MRFITSTILALAATAIAAPVAEPAPVPIPEAFPDAEAEAATGATSVNFPFTHIVAFGDNLSDNGSGSVAHGVAQEGDPSNTIYGYKTWTNGPVAIQYVATTLGLPLRDYAFGHANGGSLFGATIDNSFTQSTAHAPSTKDQIANYSSSPFAKNAKTGLAFLWIGANDINLYHLSFQPGANNANFANQFSDLLVGQVQSLLNLGFKGVFVPNLYAKNISPSKIFYASNQAQYDEMGTAIRQANAAIKTKLAKFGSKVVYHNVFSQMMKIWNNHDDYGITHVGGEFCDGYSQLDWELCVVQKKGREFYWMQYLDPTTRVHQLIATKMVRHIRKAFGS